MINQQNMSNTTDYEVVHQQRYAKLLTELAEFFQVDANVLKQSGHLIVNDMHIGLVDYGTWGQGRITMVLDLGPVPAVRSDTIHRQLLEQNLLLPSRFGVFAIIPESGHIALLSDFELAAELTGETLGRHMTEVSAAHVDVEKSLAQVERNKQANQQRHPVQSRLMNQPIAAK